MDARITRAVALTAALLVSMGARHRSANFIVETSDPNLAAQIAQAAEQYRHDLAIEWLGQPMPNWSQPCPMTVNVGPNLGAGGATTFVFDHGEVFGWRMTIQGSPQRVLDSVLPHEVTHMIYASHFRQPLPRWADEGGATTVENISERTKYQRMLDQFLRTGRGIAFGKMFAMTEYPPDVMPLYAQCYSLAEYLIQIGGRRKYIEFLDDGLKNKDWSAAVERNYGVKDLGQLQNTWLAWVKQGSPPLTPGNTQPAAGAAPELLAANSAAGHVEPNSMYGQQGANRSSPSTVIPVGRLVPVPASLFNSAMAANNPGASPGSSPGGVRLASASSVSPASGWKTAGARQSMQAEAAQPPADQPDATASQKSQPTQPPQADPFQSQVARPQDAEQPRQVILEWSAR
ncbi:MAG: hypothetical protein ABSG67_04290 [Thermoguttaceae bacterium]